MTQPWKIITPDDIDVVAPDGSVRCRVKGYYSGKQFIIDDMSVDIRPEDEIRRLLPNGREEAFVVGDPKFYRNGPFGSHYQVVISRRGTFDRHRGGNYSVTIHGTGAGSQVNVATTGSSQTSQITSNDPEVLRELINGIRQLVEQATSTVPLVKLPPERQETVTVALAELSAASEAPSPDAGRLRRGLESLKHVMEHAAGHVIGAGILTHIDKLLGMVHGG